MTIPNNIQQSSRRLDVARGRPGRAAWTWEEAESDLPMPCDVLEKLDLSPMFTKGQLCALDVRGIQFGSWDERNALCLNTDLVGLTDGVTTTEDGCVYRVDGAFYFVRIDARNPLPFADHCVDWVYAEHFIEHLTAVEAIRWLREVRRMMTPDGLLRLTTPDLRKYLEGYVYDNGFFQEHRERLGVLGARSGDLPHRRAFMVNQIFQFHGHQWIYDVDELRYALSSAGFPVEGIAECSFREGAMSEVAELDRWVRNDETIYVEARS